MTGLDRLRELADDVTGSVWANTSSIYCKKYGLSVDDAGGSFSDFLRQIADQIEAEQDERVTRRLEDREAAELVREHGGLDSVKKLLDWVVGHYSTRQQLDFDFWLSGRVMHELGFEEDMADRDEVERRLLARLMPEGMEWLVEAWPRFEDDGPVRLLDDFERYGEENGVSIVTMYQDGSFALNCRAYSKGERVNRPAPKVLDADGVEIYKGRIAYGTRGRKYRVTELCEYEPSIVHAQAIDDGELGDEFIAANTGLNSYQLDASKLTHERPDSFEQLEKDANDLIYDIGFHLGDYSPSDFKEEGDSVQDRVRDLVLRAKALAGVSGR